MSYKWKNLFTLSLPGTNHKGEKMLGQTIKRTFNKVVRGKLKIGDRRKAHRNDTENRRRVYDPA